MRSFRGALANVGSRPATRACNPPSSLLQSQLSPLCRPGLLPLPRESHTLCPRGGRGPLAPVASLPSTYGGLAPLGVWGLPWPPLSSTGAILVTGGLLYYMTLFGAMILSPRKPGTPILRTTWVFTPLCVMYIMLLAASWQSDTLSIMMPGDMKIAMERGPLHPQFIPELDGITTLFKRSATALSALIHLAAINLFMGRSIYLEGLTEKTPTGHSLLLAMFFAPLGLLCHMLTKAALAAVDMAINFVVQLRGSDT